MDTEVYKKYKREVYAEFMAFLKQSRLSFRIDRQKTDELMKQDPTVTLEMIKNDFAEYPLVGCTVIDNKQVALCPK